MPNEYIHYIKRSIVTNYPNDIVSPWFSELQAYEDGFESPLYHITRSTSWPAINIKEGDIIWLVGQLLSPWGKLLPSIDAKIEVKTVEQISETGGKLKHRYLPTEKSKWFPLSDASLLLSKLRVISKNGEISIPYKPEKNNIGQAFQSMKQIYSVNEINDFVVKIESTPFDFISYRIVDGTKLAFLKANLLLVEGRIVFWDRWSLPRRLAERRELVSDKALDLLLKKKIEQSNVVWGIETPKYAQVDSYSAKEKSIATLLQKYQPVYPDTN
jgi:hypothetical protein